MGETSVALIKMSSDDEEDQNQWLNFTLSKQLRFILLSSLRFVIFSASRRKNISGTGAG
jgi:hypothetical protein